MKIPLNEKVGGISKVSAKSDPTQESPTFSRADLGAILTAANIIIYFIYAPMPPHPIRASCVGEGPYGKRA